MSTKDELFEDMLRKSGNIYSEILNRFNITPDFGHVNYKSLRFYHSCFGGTLFVRLISNCIGFEADKKILRITNWTDTIVHGFNWIEHKHTIGDIHSIRNKYRCNDINFIIALFEFYNKGRMSYMFGLK